MTIRLATDIGGTFTDLVLEDDGTRHTVKVLTTLDRPADGLMLDIDRILEQAGTFRHCLSIRRAHHICRGHRIHRADNLPT